MDATDKSQINNHPQQLKIEDKSCASVDEKNIWKGDALGRVGEAVCLENLIAGQNGPLTLCLHGEWGTGKTFFLRRFKVQWEANGGKALYFNAWEDDNLDDPLIALIGQLWRLVRPEGLNGILDDIKKTAWPLLKKIGLAKVGIDEQSLTSPTEAVLNDYENRNSVRKHFRECISQVAEYYAQSSGCRPLLFIIDELDRCRPTFAVELLERIKHFFPIQNLVFLIGVDRVQMQACVKSVYGEIDAENYLHRFFDVTVKLKPPYFEGFVYAYLSTYNSGNSAEASHFSGNRNNFAENLCKMSLHYKLSLREVEIAIRTYTILQCARSSSAGSHTVLSAIMIVLMMKNPTAYTHLLTWGVPIGSLIDEIFGDLSECEDLRSQNSPVEIIYYIYGLAMHYDTESAQHSEIQVLLDAIEKGKAFDRNSMLIPSCLRYHKDLNINEFFARVKKGMHTGYYNFRGAMKEIDDHLQLIDSVRLP